MWQSSGRCHPRGSPWNGTGVAFQMTGRFGSPAMRGPSASAPSAGRGGTSPGGYPAGGRGYPANRGGPPGGKGGRWGPSPEEPLVGSLAVSKQGAFLKTTRREAVGFEAAGFEAPLPYCCSRLPSSLASAGGGGSVTKAITSAVPPLPLLLLLLLLLLLFLGQS